MTTNLPTWDQMTDLDKGAALLHAYKRDKEGPEYAVAEYPAEYFDHPALTALGKEEASAHAAEVAGGWDTAFDRFGFAEVRRLYDLALDEDDRRLTAKLKAKTNG